jgi:integrase
MARQHEALIKAELLKGLKAVKPDEMPTFRAWAKEYLNLEEITGLKSFRDRKQIVNRLSEHFGDKPLGDIMPQHIEGYRKARLAAGRTVATVNYDHAVLKHVLGIAERRGLIVSNPAKKVKIPTPQNERDHVLTPDEWKRLYDASPQHLKGILTVAYHTGMRIGEVLNLDWDRVNVGQGFIRLRPEDTKNGEPRVIPLTLIPDGRAFFGELSKVRRLDTNRVFLYRGRPMKRVHHAFYTACRRAGIAGLHIHDLRHCAATNLRRAGVDTVTAMKIVGHKSEKMHRRYNSVNEHDLTTAAGKLNTYLITASNTLITPPLDSVGVATVSA